MFRPALSIALFFALALGGCGKSEQKQAAAKPVEKAIYLSAADCADGGKLKPEECDTLIDRAVKAHEATSEKFKGLRSCEEAAGIDRCEKDVSGTYRMRLQAFMFEIGGPQPIVTALYPSIEGKVGFRDPKKKPVDARDDNITVSQASLQIAFENAKIGKKGR